MNNAENKLLAREYFDLSTEEEILEGVKIAVKKHLQCIRDGHFMTINDVGVWCSLDDLEPGDLK